MGKECLVFSCRNKQRPFGVREKYCITVLHDMRSTDMNLVHDSPVRGHRWFKRTLQRCGETFRWKEMRFDIEAYIKECEWHTRIMDTKMIPLGCHRTRWYFVPLLGQWSGCSWDLISDQGPR